MPGRGSSPFRSRIGGDSGLRRNSGKVIGFRGFSREGKFIDERGTREDPEGAKWNLVAVHPWTAPGWRLGAPYMPPSSSVFDFFSKHKSCKFSADSEKIPRLAFLKQNGGRKRKLALEILLIG